MFAPNGEETPTPKPTTHDGERHDYQASIRDRMELGTLRHDAQTRQRHPTWVDLAFRREQALELFGIQPVSSFAIPLDRQMA